MGKNKLISLFCLIAFAMVFAHSIIPHCHHCLEQGHNPIVEHEQHDEQGHSGHHHCTENCEQLDTYILSSGTDVPGQDMNFVELIPAEFIFAGLIDKGTKLFYDDRDKFPDHSLSEFSSRSLRAPPTV